jgi:hypothetical protein
MYRWWSCHRRFLLLGGRQNPYTTRRTPARASVRVPNHDAAQTADLDTIAVGIVENQFSAHGSAAQGHLKIATYQEGQRNPKDQNWIVDQPELYAGIVGPGGRGETQGESGEAGRLEEIRNRGLVTAPVQQRTLEVRAASIGFDPIVGISQSPWLVQCVRGISILTRPQTFSAIDFACRNSNR